MRILQLSLAELQRRRQGGKTFLLLDVCIGEETAVCTLPSSVHVPTNLIPPRSNGLPDGLPTVMCYHHGVRNLHTAVYLADAGFKTLYNLRGGIDAQAVQIDESMACY